MTIHPEDIKIGDTLYRVEEVHNWIHGRSNKIKMVDEDGVEWFRYEKPNIEYVIESWEVIGKVTPMIEGEVEDSEHSYTIDIVLKNKKTSEKETECILFDKPLMDYFTDLGDAESVRQDKENNYKNI